MVQTICSYKIFGGEKRVVLEKPHVLSRIFFSIQRIADQTAWYTSEISFDDPLFHSFFALNGALNYFEAAGADIFQGNIWVFNNSDVDFWYAVTEILH